MRNCLVLLSLTILLLADCNLSAQEKTKNKTDKTNLDKAIHIYHENSMYWQYNCKPVFLFGGSDNDNLHQNADIIEQLDLLQSLGGNFVRGNMSWRDKGNVKPFKKVNGLYDLNQWDEEYWHRFKTFQEETKKRNIIIQLEIWPTVDFYRITGPHWSDNPFNPALNSNYTAEESGLPEAHDYFHWEKINPFFETVPGLSNENTKVLKYQQRFVAKILSYTLQADNILYCMNNENYTDPRWGQYWISFIRKTAKQKAKRVYTTDMWDDWDITNGNIFPLNYVTSSDHPNIGRANVQVSLDNPQFYDFIDISNNNAQFNEIHYATTYWLYRYVRNSNHPRPINVAKIYGGPVESRWAGNSIDGAERFWRNLFAGCASTRFHRPALGNGLSKYAQIHIKSMAMLLSKINLFRMQPDTGFVCYKGGHEVYALSNQDDKEYALLFLDGGNPSINSAPIEGKVTFHWLNIMESLWLEPKEVVVRKSQTCSPPDDRFWALVIKK